MILESNNYTYTLNSETINDYLTYCSWKAQITLHGMSFMSARKLYSNAQEYEKTYEQEKGMPTFSWVSNWNADGPYENHEVSETEREAQLAERSVEIENLIEVMDCE